MKHHPAPPSPSCPDHLPFPRPGDQDTVLYPFPVQLHPHAREAAAFEAWGTLVRRLHVTAVLATAELVRGRQPDAHALWAWSGHPDGLWRHLPEPFTRYTLPSALHQKSWRAAAPGLTRDHFRAFLRAADLLPQGSVPHARWLTAQVADHVYRPFALPRAGRLAHTAHGLRTYAETFQVPGPLDPLVVPLRTVTRLDHGRVGISLGGGTFLHVAARTDTLPLRLWVDQLVTGELRGSGGKWTLWLCIPQVRLFGPPTRGAVGVDPGLRVWATTFDDQGRSGELHFRDVACSGPAGRVRFTLEQAVTALMPYRTIFVEGTDWAGSGWRNGTGASKMCEQGHLLFPDWLGAMAAAHGNREVIFTPPLSSSRTCARCGRAGERHGPVFHCRECGSRSADENAAAVHLQRGRDEGVPWSAPLVYLH